MEMIFPWQKMQWQHLITRKKTNSLPHALLLSGAAGFGKFIFAKALAEFLLCQSPNDFACGNCKSCQLLLAQTHPDLLIVQPEEDGKTIKIDQIRWLIEVLSKTSQQGAAQVVIIEPAEAMNIAANNALLKTLEEPPGNVILLLVSHQPSLLPATVRSRCQKINFTMSANINVREWMETQVTAEQDIELLLALAEQAPLKAVTFAKSNYIQQRNLIIKSLIDLVSKKIDPVKSVAMLSDIDFKSTILTLLTLLADMLKSKFNNELQYFINPDKLPELKQLANKIPLKKLLNLQEQIEELNKLMNKNINLNATLALENFFINWIILKRCGFCLARCK